MNIPESDWKKFKKLHPKALDRFCSRILEECRGICDNDSLSSHERYLRLFKHIKKRDKDMAQAFDDYRRSTAVMCLRAMGWLELLTDEEIAEFSPEVQYLITADF
jgi:hypothetical protein